MIRPLTFACMLLAGGAGLYVYQIKHQAQMLDRDIERTIVATDAARQRISMLRAEWALLQEPERLSKLVDQYLPLKTLQPAQFVPMMELASHLPAALPPGPAVLPEETAPAASLPIAQAAPRPPLMASARPAAPAPASVASPRAMLAAAAPVQTQQRPAPKLPVPTVTPPQMPSAAPVLVAQGTSQAAIPLPPMPAAAAAPSVLNSSSPRQVMAPILSVLATPISSAAAQPARESQRDNQVARAAAPARPTPKAAQGGSVLGMAQTGTVLPPPQPIAAHSARTVAR